MINCSTSHDTSWLDFLVNTLSTVCSSSNLSLVISLTGCSVSWQHVLNDADVDYTDT